MIFALKSLVLFNKKRNKMKRYFKCLTIALIFAAQNLFAQSSADAQSMDMGIYAEWAGSVFLIFLFIMFGVFLSMANKPSENSVESALQSPTVLIKQKINAVINKQLSLLPVINLDLRRVRYVLTSALIMFTAVLFLLIIQK